MGKQAEPSEALDFSSESFILLSGLVLDNLAVLATLSALSGSMDPACCLSDGTCGTEYCQTRSCRSGDRVPSYSGARLPWLHRHVVPSPEKRFHRREITGLLFFIRPITLPINAAASEILAGKMRSFVR